MRIDTFIFKTISIIIIFFIFLPCYSEEITPKKPEILKTQKAIELDLTQLAQENKTNQFPPDNSQSTMPLVPENQALSRQGGAVSHFGGWVNGNYAFGNLGGFRQKFENSGLKIYGSFLNDNFMNLHGGKTSENEPEYEGLTGLAAEVDTKKLHLWNGGKGYLLFNNNSGQGISNFVGVLQTINDYEGPPSTKLTENWYQQSFYSGLIKVKGGRQDANTDFGSLAVGNLFINNTFTFSQNIPLPTFPATRTGVSGSVNPLPSLSIKAGWQHSIVAHSFDIAEIDYYTSIKRLPAKYLYGMWIDTSNFAQIEPAGLTSSKIYSNNYGIYTAFQQMLYRKKENSDNGLVAIGRFGWAPGDRNTIAENYACGLAYKGLFNRRA